MGPLDFFRSRIDAVELPLKAKVNAAFTTGAVKSEALERVTVDTTAEEALVRLVEGNSSRAGFLDIAKAAFRHPMNTVLEYHNIGVPPSGEHGHESLWVAEREFAWQCEWLAARGYGTLCAAKYEAGLVNGSPPKSYWLTFDDGRRNNYEVAFPLLVKHGLRGTFFVMADRLLEGGAAHFSVAEAREMIAAGMSIGSHSCTHPHLARIPVEQMRREVFDSKAKLEDALQVPMHAFCYPYGNWNHAVVAAVEEAGYLMGVSTIRRNSNRAADRFCLSRAMVKPGMANWRFPCIQSPGYALRHAWRN
jgi:peptidoglycan/xylan/chitin deacetylase (PgdA/CDA1 family)